MAKAKNIARRLKSVVFALALLAAGCSGASDKPTNDVGEPANNAVPKQANNVVVDTAISQSSLISLDYLPDEDGFQFANYGGGAAPASLTVNLARRLYGDEQACASVDDSGKCVPHPVMLQLIDQANRAMAGGLCEGFAVCHSGFRMMVNMSMGTNRLTLLWRQSWLFGSLPSLLQKHKQQQRSIVNKAHLRLSRHLLKTLPTQRLRLVTHWASIRLKVGTLSRLTQWKQLAMVPVSTSTIQTGPEKSAGSMWWAISGPMR